MNKINPVVCLPTRNEEKSIELMINNLKSLNLPVFITDADSTDMTVDIAKKQGVKNYQRMCGLGKGSGIRTAIDVAEKIGYNVLVYLDCDCTYPFEKIPEFLSYFPEHDIVVGVRDMKNVPFVRKLPNIFHSILTNILFLSNLHDVNSGMRAFKIEKMKGLTAEGFDIEAEMTCKSIKRKLRIKEVKIPYYKRIGDSSVKISDGFLIAWRIIKERFNGTE